MNSAEYEQFTATLLRTLEENPAVLGMVALGTMAEPTWRDAWSDHDFWVVTRPGRQDGLLDDLNWLPNSDTILVRARHGSRHYSVLYRSGHRAEFAVFDPEEAATGTVTAYRVLFDRADVAAVAARAREHGRPQSWSEARGVFIFDNFLILLCTAVARWHRGEQLSARRYLDQFALDSLLALALTDSADRDPVDPRRHIERRHPRLAQALESLACRPVPEKAIAMLDLAEQNFMACRLSYPQSRAAEVRALLAASKVRNRDSN
jgi:hypothetical protein